MPNLHVASKKKGQNQVRDSTDTYSTPHSKISIVKTTDCKIIGQNQVRDSTITENLQKPSENRDDVEISQTSDELDFLEIIIQAS